MVEQTHQLKMKASRKRFLFLSIVVLAAVIGGGVAFLFTGLQSDSAGDSSSTQSPPSSDDGPHTGPDFPDNREVSIRQRLADALGLDGYDPAAIAGVFHTGGDGDENSGVMNSGPTAVSEAYEWLVNLDPQSLPANATNLIQRYVLAVFHLATSSPNKPWKSCDYYSWKQNVTNNNNNNNMTQSDYCEFAPDIDENRAQNGTEAIWMSGARECEWAGVVCDQATDSMVEIIVVNNMGLSQTVPSEIGMLTHLQLLHMSANELVGTLPSELANLRKLENFHINSNDLTGMIPSWLFDMPTLTTLGLNNNRFSGTISTSIGQ